MINGDAILIGYPEIDLRWSAVRQAPDEWVPTQGHAGNMRDSHVQSRCEDLSPTRMLIANGVVLPMEIS